MRTVNNMKVSGTNAQARIVGRWMAIPGKSSGAHVRVPTVNGCNRQPHMHGQPVRGSVATSAFNFLKKAAASVEAKETPVKPPGVGHHKFELPLAIALAGAAFEAYMEPTGAEGFQEFALNGSEVTFTDSEFLATAYQGILHVELMNAKGLRVADVTGASDPYAVVSVGASTARSKVINACLDPVWNQSFLLYVRNMQEDILTVRLYDEDMLKSDDDLGVAKAALSILTPGQSQTLTLPLRGPGGQGEVTIKIKALKFSEHMLDTLTSDGTAMPQSGGPASGATSAELGQKLLAAAASTDTNGNITQRGLGPLPDLNQLKDQVSTVLDKMGLLNTPEGVTSEDVITNPWKVLARMAGSTHAGTWTPVAYVDNPNTDTQAWLYKSSETREVVLAFRGTEQVKWKDLATDVNLTPCSLNPERVDDGANLPLPLRLLRAAVPTDEMMVHSGFLSAYDAIKPQVFSLLDLITKQQNPLDLAPWKVYVTGHSLGGALATLCAYELAARRGPARERQNITMYTYGAPRVGNKVFAEAFDKLVPDSWRVTNSNDIVPSVPRLLGYAHVKHSVRLEGGKLSIQSDEGLDVFGEGRGGLDVIQEIADQVTQQDRSWEEVYEEIKTAELAILDRLVNGKALEEHMEDFYLAALKQVVVASTGGSVASAVTEAAAEAKDKPK